MSPGLVVWLALDPLQRAGLTVLGGVVFLLLFGIVAIDFWLEFNGERPLGVRIAHWARRYPWFGAILAAIFGAMVGHFFFPPFETPPWLNWLL